MNVHVLKYLRTQNKQENLSVYLSIASVSTIIFEGVRRSKQHYLIGIKCNSQPKVKS